ncbi:beta-ketoacyl-ACP synthase II [Rubrivirga sp. S365]|uniref:3-oxoacyl-[acyl-carrier-protein] synthase 2 n=1 Tax=Rubrivirga litoralis TaxID=3075598 RepID=A0ABU3BLR9_9BACT|nr:MULTISPECIES: beta-ketoacyl-ACP synthase II [unclassified Rubrivirga]MDT0630234.1 beta-ketoacyl-ACP synthase II [Rubrivirga sp. F394]MDT7855745.1 beta-ketoacyl-ACP synthase II [Rubrivirga sp. S365]
MPTQDRRVVVTGLGALTPIGNTVPAFWEAMMAGRSGAAPITHFDASAYPTTFAAEIKDFDPEDFLDRKEARRLDPFAQFAIVAADEALADAGLNPAEFSEEERAQTGVVMGSGIGGMKLFQDQTVVYAEHGPRRLSPFFVPMMIIDMAPGLISIRHGLHGPNYATVSACATSNNAIADATMLIRSGLADTIIAGGTDASITEIGLGGFGNMKALSTRNDDPQAASRPFDAERDGFVMGEGAGALVLEEYEHARARGAHVYAEVVGMGMSADAYHISAPHPEGLGARLAMQQALKTAGIGPDDVDYLNMHGTSTPLGDAAETKAIKAVFGEHAYTMNLSSTKSMTGHLLGAAGAVEAIAAILAIERGRIPPTINFETPDPECDLNYTFNEPQERTVDVALSNAFGFGGHNTCIVFKKVEA